MTDDISHVFVVIEHYTDSHVSDVRRVFTTRELAVEFRNAEHGTYEITEVPIDDSQRLKNL